MSLETHQNRRAYIEAHRELADNHKKDNIQLDKLIRGINDDSDPERKVRMVALHAKHLALVKEHMEQEKDKSLRLPRV